MKTSRIACGSLSRSFKQAITSGGRVIMPIADESILLNSLYTKDRKSDNLFNHNIEYLLE